MGIIDKLKQRPSWALAPLLFTLYGIIFVLVSNEIIATDLLFGFCVWRSPDEPSISEGCTNSLTSFIIDCVVSPCWCILHYGYKQTEKRVCSYTLPPVSLYLHTEYCTGFCSKLHLASSSIATTQTDQMQYTNMGSIYLGGFHSSLD